MVVICSISLGVCSGLLYGARLSQDAQMRAAAVLASQRHLEMLRSAALDPAQFAQLRAQWNNGWFDPYIPGGPLRQNQCWGRVTVTPVGGDPNLLEITVIVSWRDGSQRLFGTDNTWTVGPGQPVTLVTRFAAR